ncbi:pleckstrin homology domain-containing family H member 1-like isoform X1 [Haliotis cracherodii]|uniref:pleckstrin homology domain-containing family H member 1-like isoform X1 n=2 Tax=Haliotis cracherodii TaxID=6455 RepID=UPI0039EA8165
MESEESGVCTQSVRPESVCSPKSEVASPDSVVLESISPESVCPDSESPHSGSTSSENSNWQSRCQLLEGSLLRFQQQATRIRENLGHQMRDLEEKLSMSEARAETAEQQLEVMEQQLAAMNWKPCDLEKRVQELERELQEKDKRLRAMQHHLEEQTQLRHHDARIVEAKALKIKEWVTNKLHELEEQNHEIQRENDMLQQQVELLRDRLQSLPAQAVKEIYRLSLEMQEGSISRSTSRGSEPPEIPQRPRSSVLEAMHREMSSKQSSLEDAEEHISEGESEESMGDMDHEQLYQEVDANHESIYEPKRLNPPQIKIERKILQSAHLLDSLVSSCNGSEEMLERARVSISQIQKEFNGHEVDEQDLIIAEEITPISLTPKTPMTPLTPFLPDAPPSTPTNFFSVNFDASNISAIATLPRVRKEKLPGAFIHSDNTAREFIPHRELITGVDIQVHHFANSEPTDIGAAGRRSVTITNNVPKQTEQTSGPHTKPVTSEKRIYAVANKRTKGWRKVSEVKEPSPIMENHAANNLYRDFTVPVYATLKGKAAQIRSTPFMEETSSDSSENEEEIPVAVVAPSQSAAGVSSMATDTVQVKTPSAQTTPKPVRSASCHSAASEVSCDYALPPDDSSGKSDSDTSEPEQKLLKFAADSQKHDTLEKCGYLSKLSGKVKTWKRRWFTLRNGELFYYKSQHDVLRKPQGSIKLDEQTRISRSSAELTFEITNPKKTYYLSANSIAEMDRWMRLLNRVIKRQATSYLLDNMDGKAVVKGWITKVKNGTTRRCWCVLLSRHFLYYKTPSDKTPIGQIQLRDVRLEEIDGTCDSDDESDVATPSRHVIAIWPPCQGPTYLVIPTKQEKDSWLYHLTVATGGGAGTVGTDFEQLVSKLMEANGDPNSVMWKHPILLHTKEPISRPMTTLPSEDLQEKAVELFKSMYQFINTVIESPSLEFHVTLAQSILHSCLEHPELQNELYCQLIKQTSRHPGHHKTAMQNLLLCGKHSWFLCDGSPTSPTSSVMDLSDSKMNPQAHVIMQGWQLMSLCVSLFLPKQSVMWLLKVHLQRHADPRTEPGKYAIFCQRALERIILKGVRESKPSRMEVMSMLLRHPYHHSQPISIPVHFLNDTYQVVSFDGSTTVQEFLGSLHKMISVRDCSQSGFALYTDDPAGTQTEHCLQTHLKVCDIISKWEQAFRDHHSGNLDQSKAIRILYKNRLYFSRNSRSEMEKEKLLLAYQVNDEIVHGRFPLNRDLALELTSLMAQVEFGDMRMEASSSGSAASSTSSTAHQHLITAVTKFYPKKYHVTQPEEQASLLERLAERWLSLQGRTSADCIRVYLAVARKWQYYGAKLFRAKIKCPPSSDEDIWLAVQEDGVSVLELVSMQPVALYDFKSIITFGGWKNDFMVVVNQLVESAPHHYEHHTEKLIFAMSQPKILAITLLIADYINIKLQQPSPEAMNGDT